MSKYAKANLFVGKYQIPESGHIRLSDRARVRYLRGHETSEGWKQAEAGEPDELWLMVEDGDFWPVMIRLELGRDERQP